MNKLRNFFQNNKIPIIIVHTQSIDIERIKEIENFIKDNNIGDFIDILALPIKIHGHNLESYNLDKLVEKTIKKSKEILNGDMIYFMIDNISGWIQENLYKENCKIKNKINEEIILNLKKQDENQKEEEFQKNIINIYGKIINYYLNNPNISINTILDIQNSMFITNKNNYFKYIQKLEDNIISKELSNKLTMPKSKRSYD